jgi:hypothetical protein
VSLAISCPASEAGGCSGTVSLATLVKVRPGKGPARRNRARRRRLQLGNGAFQAAGGRSAVVRIRLSRKHRSLLARLPRFAALATIAALDAAGNARTTKLGLTVKAVKRSR